jgi:outer membrane protein TolC
VRLRQPLILTAVAILAVASAPAHGADGEPGAPFGLFEVVREALARNPGIRIAELGLLEGVGRLRELRGVFDTTFEATLGQDFTATPLGDAAQDASGEALGSNLRSFYSLGAERLLPSGIRVKPSISFERVDPLSGSEPSSNMTSITLRVDLPLMQGKGEEVIRADERAAEADLEARRLLLVQTSAASVSEVVTAYWDYLAAFRSREILTRSEEKAEQLLDIVRRLVEADERPLVDMVPLRASLASRQVSRLLATRYLERARHALAEVIGLEPEEVERLGIPSTDFPPLEKDELPGAALERFLIGRVETRRADLMALDREASGIRAGLAAVRDGLRPKLDLTVAAGVDGLSEGGPATAFLLPAGIDGIGPRLSVAVSYAWPVGRNAQKGALLQREAVYEKAAFGREDRLRQIGLSISAAMADLLASARALETIQVAAAYHLETVRAEERKLTMGLTTIMEVIRVEDSYIAALLDEVDARSAFASSIIALRLASGTILAPEPGEQSVVLQNLNSIP